HWKQVGRRTTFRLLSGGDSVPTGWLELETQGMEITLQHIASSADLREFVAVSTVGFARKLYALDPSFSKYAIKHSRKGLLTTGMLAVLLATQICTKVTLFGFHLDQKVMQTAGVAFHYFDEEVPRERAMQQQETANNELRSFIHSRPATHFVGEPCMLQTESCDNVTCVGCADGSQCQCDVWHPVPKEGYCYEQESSSSETNGEVAAGKNSYMSTREKQTLGIDESDGGNSTLCIINISICVDIMH
ncbi:hypothetical protein CYMTET_21909, partial [Cymbomonas tetramitiformis]